MDQPPPELVDCPTCGAKNPAVDNRCAACGKSLTVIIGPRPKMRHVGLGSVMIVIAVLAVCLAPIRFAWPLSLLMAMLFVPATIHGVIALERRRLDGRPTPVGQAIGLFVRSFFLVFWIALATVIGFVATCVPVGIATTMKQRSFEPNLIAACGAGAISGFAALWYVAKKLWPGKD